jgi:LysM repeat protein
VLVVALVLSGYATVSHQLPSGAMLRLGVMDAEGLVLGQGGSVNGVDLGRLSTIITPFGVPTGANTPHQPLVYVVQRQETMVTIANRFGLSVEQLRWSNPFTFAREPKPGDRLAVPPVPGVVITVQAGDSLSDIARVFHLDPTAVADFNYLRNGTVTPGTALVLPGATHPDLSLPLVHGMASAAVGDHFPYGQCTWYVASRRPIPWNGNAGDWFAAAQALNWPTGQMPQPGAIMVTWESWYGHVAYVERVNSDGSWVVSEMNYAGWGQVDQRTIKPGGVPLIGFIY